MGNVAGSDCQHPEETGDDAGVLRALAGRWASTLGLQWFYGSVGHTLVAVSASLRAWVSTALAFLM